MSKKMFKNSLIIHRMLIMVKVQENPEVHVGLDDKNSQYPERIKNL
jgi:hypothetical protein